MWERNVGRDGLTDYEYLLDKDQLSEYIEKEAQDLWPVKKGRGLAFDYAAATQLLFRERPALYERSRTLVQRDTEPVTHSRAAEAVRKGVADGRRALETLEALAHALVAKGRATDYGDGMARAIRERPDLYAAHAAGVRVQKVVR